MKPLTFAAWAAAAGVVAAVTLPPAFLAKAEPRETPALPATIRSLTAATEWAGAPPLRPDDLRGKVVLVNFWTYSCINSLRALPYTRAWAEKYRSRGLVVVGVHTPEFAFEKDLGNVRRASAALGVTYAAPLDSDYRIWRAFDNNAWPAFYFIGRDGKVRRQVLGEGGYDKSERLIQQLLSEGAGAPVDDPVVPIVGQGAQAAPDFADVGSPETYLGYGQATAFASDGGLRRDVQSNYKPAAALRANSWSLAGRWTSGREFATLAGPSGAVSYRFHARDLHMVLAPAVPGQAVRYRITIDGAAPGVDRGVDVDAAGRGRVDAPRMYQLVRQRGQIADHTFRIEFLDPGVRAYVFTFG